MSRKRKNIYFILFLLVYILILFLIVHFEKGAEGGTIEGIMDAFWYSMATITTVGYGDYYPVTMIGRILGLIFMLLSVGFFGFIISFFVSKFSGKLLPVIMVLLAGGNNCYIFDGIDENALCLADSINEHDDNGLIIICGSYDKEMVKHKLVHGVVFAQIDVNDILKLRRKNAKNYVFTIGDAGYQNYQKALTYEGNNMDVYCEAPVYVDGTPAHIHIFNKYTCVAGYLWRKHPLTPAQKNIVFIGCDNYGTAIIEQALLVNVDKEVGNRHYHIFGNTDKFRNLHTEMGTCFGIDANAPGKDTIYYHNENLFTDLRFLHNADCIFIVTDSDEENLRIYNDIYKFVPGNQQIFIRECSGIDINEGNSIFFGGSRSVMNYDIVIKDEQSRQAREMHEKYCRNNPEYNVTWEKLNLFTRRSNMAVADHIPTKLRILLNDSEIEITEERMEKARKAYAATKETQADMYRRIEHERWMRFHVLNNWKYNEKRDNSMRVHNMIVPFEDLSPANMAKDDYSWEIL